jgi:hypothetical protein
VRRPVALPGYLHDVRVMQQPVEHRGGQRLVIGQGVRLLRERQVAREDHAAALMALGLEQWVHPVGARDPLVLAKQTSRSYEKLVPLSRSNTGDYVV